MNKSWGKKRVCPGCSVRYYDMKNPTPVCPKCGTVADVLSFSKGRRKNSDLIPADIGPLEGLDEDVEPVDLDTDEEDFDQDIQISVDTGDDDL